MDLALDGKVAVVTGGASGGLGEGILRALLEEGARCVAADRDAEPSAGLIDRLSGRGEIVGHVADVSLADFADGVLATAVTAFGGIDVVVNNAAIYPSRRWDEYTLSEWERCSLPTCARST
jgi:NAD(P)-dependent dehydrogenase (short-subunit alcohol dehydrogenase family)